MEAENPPLQPEGGDGHTSTPTGMLSCVQCRSRKLKCDRRRPKCDRCVKHSEPCTYPGTRQRPLGPRKTVRELETRIEELEGLLRSARLSAESKPQPEPLFTDFQDLDLFGVDTSPSYQDLAFGDFPTGAPGAAGLPPPANQLVGLGLFEQLPSFDVIDQLTALFFKNIHNGAPMLHEASYTASLRLPPHMRPPMCLQYIVMASAAATSPAYRHLSEPFYQRARVYAEADELKGPGETFTTLGHVQAWCLTSAYECHVYATFTRASTSLCRGVRIAQMLRLHQLDLSGPDQTNSGLPPPRNFIEAEERRRTWWVVFIADRYLSSFTGWPSLINERTIRTNLPSTEEAYAAGAPIDPAVPLPAALHELEQGRGARLSPFAIRILSANELLHALDHTANHFPESDDNNGENAHRDDGTYWRRHRAIDANLTTLTLFLPERLQLARNPRSLDAILVHTCTHMATLHLHRTALGLLRRRADSPMPGSPHAEGIIADSEARLMPAALGILAVFKMAGEAGVGTAIRNPLLSFAAYMAAEVFLEVCTSPGGGEDGGEGNTPGYERTRERRRQSEEGLAFLARVLVTYGRSSPLVRANAFQLAADMKKVGYDSSMMDSVMGQVQTLGGLTSELRVPGSKGLPMLFCPALTATLGAEDGGVYGLQGGLGYQGPGSGDASTLVQEGSMIW